LPEVESQQMFKACNVLTTVQHMRCTLLNSVAFGKQSLTAHRLHMTI